jgi:hypothetical protein
MKDFFGDYFAAFGHKYCPICPSSPDDLNATLHKTFFVGCLTITNFKCRLSETP